MTPYQREHCARAYIRALPVLKKGDRLRMKGHGSARQITVTFDHWDEGASGFFVSKSGVDELHPYNITGLNGAELRFRDPVQTITLGDFGQFRRMIPYPGPVRDGTHRCISCGQIDEPEHHTLSCEEAREIAEAEA